MSEAASRADPMLALAHGHARFAAGLPGGRDWEALRADAMARFSRLGMPSPRDESWKYSPLRLLEKRVLANPGRDPVPLPVSAIESRRLGLEDALSLVFVNGHLMASLSDSPPAGSEVQCQSLAAALEQSPGELLGRIALAGDSADERLALLNLAYLADGARISVSAGARPACLHLLSLSAGADRMHHPRLIIDVGADARLQIIEHCAGTGEEGSLSNFVTDIHLETGAQLEHVLLVEAAARGVTLNSIIARAAEKSRLTLYRVLIGGLYSRASLNAELLGPDAAVEANSLVLAADRGVLEIHSLIEHRVGDTRSNERFRGVASGHGRGVFNGRIVVQPGAAGSESQQSSRALLLSEQAEMYARPQLEILTDDVKCVHGATTGRLDPNMLFYLRSRGIDPATARALLIRAFLADALAPLQSAPLRQQLERRIATALPRSEQIGESP
jgi:Fe-S cluster assembly protein SufD